MLASLVQGILGCHDIQALECWVDGESPRGLGFRVQGLGFRVQKLLCLGSTGCWV